MEAQERVTLIAVCRVATLLEEFFFNFFLESFLIQVYQSLKAFQQKVATLLIVCSKYLLKT